MLAASSETTFKVQKHDVTTKTVLPTCSPSRQNVENVSQKSPRKVVNN